MRLEVLGQVKKKIRLIGTRTRDLVACSILPQPNTLPRDPFASTLTVKKSGFRQVFRQFFINISVRTFVVLASSFVSIQNIFD
jgi:hypothetical protein